MNDDLTFELDRAFDIDHYHYFTSHLVTAEQSQREVEFLSRCLRLAPASRILDLPCGYGRHANLLAMRGHRVTGIDSNALYIDLAVKDARSMGVDVDYRVGDMRTLQDIELYDAIIMVFTSFAMFNHDENITTLKNMARALVPGGRFCVELMNSYPLKEGYKRALVFERGDDLMIDRLSYHAEENIFASKRVYIKDGKRRDVVMSHEIFSLEQMRVILRSLGMLIDYVSPTCVGGAFESGSDKMVLFCRKEGASEV
jgi:SAM-dependent methyltransferase